MPALIQQPVSLPNIPFTQSHPSTSSAAAAAGSHASTSQDASNLASLSMDIDEDVSTTVGGDLENELREFLESGPGLHASSSSAADDNNLMAQLLMN